MQNSRSPILGNVNFFNIYYIMEKFIYKFTTLPKDFIVEKNTYKSLLGPTNPPNSIKARIITSNIDSIFSDDSSRVFWPLFPQHIMMPIYPSEMCYVIFEDASKQHGLWLCKIPDNTNINFSNSIEFYNLEKQNSNGSIDDKLNITTKELFDINKSNIKKSFG